MSRFDETKALFALPEGVVYMDGNSLGPLPRAVPGRLAAMVQDEWGEMLITAWNRAGWMAAPRRVGDRVGALIGAEPGSVVLGDTLSIKVYQALASALEMRPGRKVILSDTGNFPSDLYMAEGLVKSLGAGHELRLVAPEAVADAIDEDVAVLMLTEVDYRTGRRHDMPALTARAHEAGALAIWDLAHSAGALAVDVAGGGADFAVGCSYKFLNGGPGAPAFIYVAPRHAEVARPALSGWLGHEAPFAFDIGYRPGEGVERMRVGTPPMIQLAALEAALDAYDVVDMAAVAARAGVLADRFIAGVEAACPDMTLVTPRDASARGSQVSFAHPEGYAAMQAVIAHGLIGDFRAPDIMRFGITPLYLDEADIDRAVEILADVMGRKLWAEPRYQVRQTVT
ncbi:kynureninase [Oceanicola granulosus HTCC2516]|uniref:Kynureninase n=1 Tax=Oceanicola granulosus (strain ATCC BAA-861 / DSM 15982 / KCTC 12143 / HTCC2516) TaxID=314256 RepID=Q2C9R0_OCEGH|nr:kynureninase [Oceanicola granulosus]EAR49411.1 kynureninase [Oceanicola granulosus HTCC2516]